MNPLAVSAFFAAMASLLMAAIVFFKEKRDKVRIGYTVLTISFFVWVSGIGMEVIAPNKDWGLFWNRWLYSGAIFIPTFWTQFVQFYLNRIKRKVLTLCYALSIFFLIFNFTPFFVKDVVTKGSFNYASVPGILFPFFVFFFLVMIVYSFYLMIGEYSRSAGMRRNQLKFLILGTMIGFSGGVTNYLLVFEIVLFPPAGNYFISIGLFTLYYAIFKHRLMDINIVLKKGTTYVLLVLLLFVPSALLIILGQRLFYEQINYLFLIYVFSVLFLLAIVFYRVKPEAEKAVEQLLFKKQYDYRKTLATFSRAIVSILDLQSLTQRGIETITQTMGVERASLFLWNEEKGGYDLFEAKNVKIPVPLLPKGDPLSYCLEKFGEIIVREELVKGPNTLESDGIVRQMSSLEAEVSIPLISKGKLIGIINLSYKFNRDIYSHEDIQLLTTLANQMAVAIENARLYDDLKKSKSYIRRADRLASLGTLTAGISHEIRNPLVAIKTFTQLLPERLEDEEFRGEFLKIASGEVDRISSLVNELLEFARPFDPKLELEDVNAILDGMILLVSTETKKKQIELTKNYASDLPSIQIDREQMKQVFLNILLNAIEATAQNGKICVGTRTFAKPAGELYVQVEFTDSGCGIPKEQLETIFDPFFTTKRAGSGLGLSISNQIVQDHRGYIFVESQIHKGSSFFVNLPVNRESQEQKRRRKDD